MDEAERHVAARSAAVGISVGLTPDYGAADETRSAPPPQAPTGIIRAGFATSMRSSSAAVRPRARKAGSTSVKK